MTNNPPSTRMQPGEYGFPLKLKPRYDNFIGGGCQSMANTIQT